ncbi:hypothetical protein L7F22_048224 [Adiantum nelumboides]|nr:hypothetical protein [Adiantum nelumboides]
MHAEISKRGLLEKDVIANAAISMYSKWGQISEKDSTKLRTRDMNLCDVVSPADFQEGGKQCFWERTEATLRELQEAGHRPSFKAWNTLERFQTLGSQEKKEMQGSIPSDQERKDGQGVSGNQKGRDLQHPGDQERKDLGGTPHKNLDSQEEDKTPLNLDKQKRPVTKMIDIQLCPAVAICGEYDNVQFAVAKLITEGEKPTEWNCTAMMQEVINAKRIKASLMWVTPDGDEKAPLDSYITLIEEYGKLKRAVLS